MAINDYLIILINHWTVDLWTQLVVYTIYQYSFNLIFSSKSGRQMAVFNSQSQIQIGGRYNPTLRRVERHFEGIIAGVVYNGLRPLDLAANADAKTKVQGQVRLLDNIPFDYRYLQYSNLWIKNSHCSWYRIFNWIHMVTLQKSSYFICLKIIQGYNIDRKKYLE